MEAGLHDALRGALTVLENLDLEYVTQWAARLDASIESDEVSERVKLALHKAKR